MEYKMQSSTKPVEVAVEENITALSDDKFKKKEQPAEILRTLKVSELQALINDCLDLNQNNGYLALAAKHKVGVDLVKEIHQKLKDEDNKRNAPEEIPVDEGKIVE